MHDLLKHGAPWNWDEEVDKEFKLARSGLPTNQPEHTAQLTSPTTNGMEPMDTDSDTHSDVDPNPAPMGDHG